MPRFYEFFAGGGMARAGLGPGWSCAFANDIDPKKAACYVRNWGGEDLHVADVSAVTSNDLPGRGRSCLGVVPLSGLVSGWVRPRAAGPAIRNVLAVLEADDRARARRPCAEDDRTRERLWRVDFASRSRLRDDWDGYRPGWLSLRCTGHQCDRFRSAVAPAAVHRRCPPGSEDPCSAHPSS